MAEIDQRSEAFLRGLWDATVNKAQGMSGYMAPGLGGQKMTPDDIDEAWNHRALTVEQEWDLWRQGSTPERIAAGERKLTPEEIGMQVFPHREKLAKSAGRVQPKDWIGWVNQQANRQVKNSEQQPAAVPAEGMTTDGG